MSYLADSVSADGVRAQEVIESLAQDVGFDGYLREYRAEGLA